MSDNQNPEQQARECIDYQIRYAGWVLQRRGDLSSAAHHGVINDFDTIDSAR